MSTGAQQARSADWQRTAIERALRAIPQQRAHVSIVTRAIEIVFASVALLLTWPIIAVMAMLIKRGSAGPALFFQNRVGANGRLFRFVKFRTMYADAKQRFPELYQYDYSPTEVKELRYKYDTDPRITPQGRWMRFSSLDELPNFWNVLTGEVALVGPRPEIPEMLPYYTQEELRKFSVRPGITGLAQISGRGRLRFKEVVGYDVEYVDKRSVLFDLKILALTMLKVVTHDGAF